MTQERYREELRARARRMLAALEQRAPRSLWSLTALVEVEAEPEKIAAVVLGDLGQDPPRGGPFQIMPAAILLRRWEEKLPEAAVEHIRSFATGGVLERGNTENHWLMYYAGNLLLAERWRDEPRWWNGLAPACMLAEAKRWILGTIARTALLGHHEYDSPGYHIHHLIPMLALADLARDAAVRTQAEKALTLLVADMALEYFRGAWAGGHSREGYRQNTWTRSGSIAPLQYLYFGGEAFDAARHAHGFAAPALAARYCPPALFARLAWDRERAHVVKKTRAPRSIYRHTEREAAPVRKYTYMSPSFALGSTQLGLPGAPAGPIDLVSWDLSWDAPKHQGKIVGNHPYRAAGRFSAFLANYPQTAGREIASEKPYLQWSDRLFGASPYERLMQHEGALIALYRIPEDDETPFVNLYLPRGMNWLERDGWIMADAGGFYLGLYPIGPYQWMEIRENAGMIYMMPEPDLIDGWLLRIDGPEAGVALEVVEAAEAGDFAHFRRHRSARPPDLSDWSTAGRVCLEDFKGRRLEMLYEGEHRVDGAAIDYPSYALLEAPGVEAALGSGKMSFSQGADRVELDFEIAAPAPLPPMRVIG